MGVNNMLTLLLILFTGRKVGDAGATQMADALKSNSTLTELIIERKYQSLNHHIKRGKMS